MKTIKVQYKVKASFAAENADNIKKVMDDLRNMNNEDISYISFILDDNQTFIHFLMVRTEAANDVFNNLPSFQKFRARLKESEPEEKPLSNTLTLVGSSFDLD